MTILSGKPVAAALNQTLSNQLKNLSQTLTLAIILVGDNAASLSYIGSKERQAQRLGIKTTVLHLSQDTPTTEVIQLIHRLNQDPATTGIIVQLPLPSHLDPDVIVNEIDPIKDVDGLTVVNLGRLLIGQPALVSATARGVMALLAHYAVPLVGQQAVVLGRSTLVGKPTALLLLAEGATVTIAHRQTANLQHITQTADLLISATGQPGLITGNDIKQGAIVIDVGLSRTPKGLQGDVDQETVKLTASALTPVPGGVGPLTVACLFQNLYQAHLLQQKS